MATDEHTTETRTKIADAINSAVAMTEAETDQAVDAVLDVMERAGKRLREAGSTMTRDKMIRDLCRSIKQCASMTEDSVDQEAVIMDAISIQKAAETIECMLSQSTLASFEAACEKMTAEQCAKRLRMFQWNVSENIATEDFLEDDFTVVKTWTLKGLRYFLAEQEFLALQED